MAFALPVTLDSLLEGSSLHRSQRGCFSQFIQKYSAVFEQEIDDLKQNGVVINAEDPVEYFAILMHALHSGVTIWLASPHWKEHEWAQLKTEGDGLVDVYPLRLGGSTRGDSKCIITVFPLEERTDYIYVPTGGTTGKVRFVRHTVENFIIGARALLNHLSVSKLNNLCCLPLFHVSGLMQVFRALESGGQIYFLNKWKSLSEIESVIVVSEKFAISLVPSQLNEMIEDDVQVSFLQKLDFVFIGGSHLSGKLANRARELNLPLAPCYGMSETAAMVTLLKPSLFLEGNSSYGRVMEHAAIKIKDESCSETIISAKSMFLGYHSDPIRPNRSFHTGDSGFVDGSGDFNFYGRLDDRVDSGSEKFYLSDIEYVMDSMRGLIAYKLLVVDDARWGQIVHAKVQLATFFSEKDLLFQLKDSLARHKIPKEIMVVDSLTLDRPMKKTL